MLNNVNKSLPIGVILPIDGNQSIADFQITLSRRTAFADERNLWLNRRAIHTQTQRRNRRLLFRVETPLAGIKGVSASRGI